MSHCQFLQNTFQLRFLLICSALNNCKYFSKLLHKSNERDNSASIKRTLCLSNILKTEGSSIINNYDSKSKIYTLNLLTASIKFCDISANCLAESTISSVAAICSSLEAATSCELPANS